MAYATTKPNADGSGVWAYGLLGTMAAEDIVTYLSKAGNLSGLADAAASRGNLGLGNVDNTTDANKPVSTATQTALNGKEASVSAGTTAQYYRGDKSWQTLDKTAVGLGNVDNTSDANKPVSTAQQTALNLKANLASPTFTGTVTLPASTALVTPAIGAATGTSLAATGAVTSSGTAGIGYVTGAGANITQATNRTTGVTINKVCGTITLVSAAGSATYASFTVTNSTVAATDVPSVVQKSGTDLYEIHVTAVAAGSFRVTYRTTGGTTTEQPVFTFSVGKAVAA